MAHHQWKTLASGEIDHWVVEIPDVGTEHNGPECSVCGFSFCEHCDEEFVKKNNSARSAWNFECPGPPPDNQRYDWDKQPGVHIPYERPVIILKENYQMINRKARLVRNLDTGDGETSLL